MPRFVNARELRRMWDDPMVGPQRVSSHLEECLALGRTGQPGGIRFEDFSIRDLFEEMIPDGREIVRAMYRGAGSILQEATNAADTGGFTQVVGQLMFDRLLQGYENPAFIWPQLCQQIPTTNLFGQKIPGIANLGDVGEPIGEGKPYPAVSSSAHFVETVPLVKRGFVVPITRELTISDNTGLIITRLDKTSQALGISLEKRIIDLAIGTTNNYKRNGTATNTYLTAGAYVNTIASNPLVDYRSIETAMLLFDALNDPDTGEPILMPPNLTLLVPSALLMTANRIVTATTVEHVDNQVAAQTYRTMSGNPLGNKSIEVLSSPYVFRRSTDAGRWWLGDFKGAFGRMTAWDIEKDQRGRESPLNFTNDVLQEFKGSVMDAAQVLEPRRVTQLN